jgi:hypothetical protein
MNHAITIGGLLLSVGALVGFVVLLAGVASAFGNMMADAAGDNGKQGCILFIVGLVIFVVCLIGLFA